MVSLSLVMVLLSTIAYASAVGTTSSVTIHGVCATGPGVDPRSLGFDVGRASAPGIDLGPGRIETNRRLFQEPRYRYIGDDGTRPSLLPPVRSEIGASCP